MLNKLLTISSGEDRIQPLEVPITKVFCWDEQLECWWKIHNCTPHDTIVHKSVTITKKYLTTFVKMLSKEFKKIAGKTPYTVVNLVNINALNAVKGIVHATFEHPLKVKLYCLFYCFIQKISQNFTDSLRLVVDLGEVCIFCPATFNIHSVNICNNFFY